MEMLTSKALCELADESPSMRALLIAMEETFTKEPERTARYLGYNLIRGIMIGILAERKRRNGGVQ
jgi:hypothetical protein